MKAQIDALEKEGIIEQYTIIVNPLKINNSVSAYLEVEVAPGNMLEVPQSLRDFREFEADLSALVLFDDRKE